MHCASDSLISTAFDQLNSGCSSQHLLNINFHIIVADSAVEVFPELVKCAAIHSDWAVGKMPLAFLILQTEVQHRELTVNLTNTFPKNNNKNGDDGSSK